jgi:glycosyltransferase involved in cell wall biosynthesis
MRAVFYSPFVEASDDAPSGAQQMACLFVRALEGAGVEVLVPALPTTYDGKGDAAVQAEARRRSDEAANSLLGQIRRGNVAKPDVWFSYHVYYKSPDWIGPAVSRALSIPYVVAEGSHAPKRKGGPWALSHDATTDALSAANLLLAMTAFDRVCLEWINPSRVRDFRPFIDASPFLDVEHNDGGDALRLVAVAMMRNERKRDSYRALADALKLVRHVPLTLKVAGDGKFRTEIEGCFHGLPKSQTVTFLGAVTRERLPQLLANSDVLAWPGIGEAYGLAYLEAQAAGLAAVAFRERGVVDVTADGTTALLSDSGDTVALAASIERLAKDERLRSTLSGNARAFVAQERSLWAASTRLRVMLAELRA